MVISHVVSYTEEHTYGVQTHPEDENHESNPSSREWPSHAWVPKKKAKGNFILIQF
jgi:hypothetical protein